MLALVRSIGKRKENLKYTEAKMAGFVAFDTYKTLLQDDQGKISGPRTVIAGFGAGITESLLAVTPFESIKTTLFVFGLFFMFSIFTVHLG